MVLLFFELVLVVAVLIFGRGLGSENSFAVFGEGKDPVPFSSQYRLMSGNVFTTLRTNSKLGLFRPESRWEILERWTLILSAKLAAEKP